MPQFYCSTCGQHIDADEELCGTSVECPACDGALIVPAHQGTVSLTTVVLPPPPKPALKTTPLPSSPQAAQLLTPSKKFGKLTVLGAITVLGCSLAGVWTLCVKAPPHIPQTLARAEDPKATDSADGLFAEGENCYKTKRFTDAFTYFSKAADLGHIKAHHRLGLLYNGGHGVTEDQREALRHYRFAAEQGDAESQVSLGMRVDLEGDDAEAVKWYRMAAVQGYPDGQDMLGMAYAYGRGGPKDEAEAFRWYQKAAEQGFASAQNNLGECYSSGQGVGQNFKQAFRWFCKAAEQGYASAQFNLGNLYAKGDGVVKDLSQAEEWYVKAAENEIRYHEYAEKLADLYAEGETLPKDSAKAAHWYRKASEDSASLAGMTGSSSAAFRLGCMLAEGDGVAKDLQEAAKFYRQAAEQGYARSQLALGECYASGEGVDKDPAEALNWYLKAAEQSNVWAQFRVGEVYQKGLGVEENLPMAAMFYRDAAVEGVAWAQFNLGTMYARGEGMTKDSRKAVHWLQMAAKQDHAWAQFNLGTMYDNGLGITKDLTLAAEWYRKSAEQDVASAQFNLGILLYTGGGVSKNLTESASWLRKAADQNHAAAQFNLGTMNRRGEGVVKDATEAIKLYVKAGNQGYVPAHVALGDIYATGDGVQKNPKTALIWYRKAADQGSAYAQFKLGILYDKGESVSKNSTVAVQWYRKAAEQGYIQAQHSLSIMYALGEGIPKNLAFAYKWSLLAKAGTSAPEVGKFTSLIESDISKTQAEEGQKLAAAFVAKPEGLGDTSSRQTSTLEKEGVITAPPELNPSPKKQASPSKEDYASSGTGFFITDSGVLVTAAHVVAKAKTIKALLTDGRRLRLRVLRSDEKLDLALLQVESKFVPQAILAISDSRTLTLGQSVLTIGFPNTDVQGYEPKFTDGKISALTGIRDDPNTLQVSVPIQPGNSGGPLVDMAGNVVGVVTSRLNAIKMAKETGSLSENVNYAVKSRLLIALLKGIPSASAFKEAPSGTLPVNANPDVVQTVKVATVMLIVEHK